jgi:hypothetical protein
MVPPQSMIQLPTVPVRPAARPMVAPVPSVDDTDQTLEALRKLGDLKAQGVVTDQEFATLKARIITD